MKNLNVLKFATLAISLLLAYAGFAQESGKIDPNRMLDWTLKEKFKVPIQTILHPGTASPEESGLKSGEKSISDYAVSGGTEVEAEIHAAINPTDSTNIVVSPIFQNFTSGAINCPIYWTHDFGTTWTKNTWVNMPHEAGKISGGGGDPVFAYDADGKLYFSWIDLYGAQLDFFMGNVNMGIFWAYSSDGGATWIQPQRDTILLGQMSMMFGQPSGILSPVSDKQWMACDRTSGPNRNNLYVSYVSLAQSGQNSTYQIMCKTKPAGQDYFRTQPATVTTTSAFTFVQFSSVTVDGNGNVHITFFGTQNGTTLALWHSVSTDGGLTFSSPNKISDMRFNLPILQLTPADTIKGINQQRTYPSPYMSADPVNGNIYATWTAFGITSNLGNGADVYFSMSADNGATWSTATRVNDDPAGEYKHQYYSSIFTDPSGKISLSWYDRRADVAGVNNIITHYYVASSTDGGQTFGQNIQVTSVASNFANIGSQNQKFGIGEYTQVLSTETGYTTIPVWADGRKNNGDIDIYIAFINPTQVNVKEIRSISGEFALFNITPNPVTSSPAISFELKNAGKVILYLSDETGKKVMVISESSFIAGKHTVNFDVSNIAQGHYYCVMQSDYGFACKPFVVGK